MQHLKNFNWKKFLLQGVLPCLLAVAVGFISRYQLELSDGVTESFLQLQWPLYAPLNALTAFCLTLILFALLGKWSRATGISGAVFTIIALINYYTRDLHGSALMPQDILNLGTAAEVMGSIGDIKGKTCIINDDMIDTAGTLCANVKELKAMGAGDIYVCATHGIFSGPAIERLNDAPIVECLVTDAIPVEVGGKIKTISVAEEFAQAISAVYHEEPVSTLVGGDFAL